MKETEERISYPGGILIQSTPSKDDQEWVKVEREWRKFPAFRDGSPIDLNHLMLEHKDGAAKS